MSNSRERIDPKQLSLLDYDARIDEYVHLKEEILACPKKIEAENRSWEEDCIAIAVATKAQVDESGMSREEVVDKVNSHYGWPSTEEYEALKTNKETKGVKHLSIHMFNHFLSKPTEYRIEAFYLIAIQQITDSLKVCKLLANNADAQVISGDEKRALTLGKLDETILEMQKLKKALRGRRG